VLLFVEPEDPLSRRACHAKRCVPNRVLGIRLRLRIEEDLGVIEKQGKLVAYAKFLRPIRPPLPKSRDIASRRIGRDK